MRLKIVSMLLFWLGFGIESLYLIDAVTEYQKHGTFLKESYQAIFAVWWLGTIYFIYTLFFHVPHLISGYLLSKGTRKGIVLASSICIYEVVTFFIPYIDPHVLSLEGIGARIFFAFVLFLIVSGRNALVHLRDENWRPWMDPRTPSHQIGESK